MRKFTNFIIDKRYFILVISLILVVVSGVVSSSVNINYDISKYLPKTSSTRIGMDIMEKEFKESETSTLNLMFKDLTESQQTEIKNYIDSLENVKDIEIETKDNYTLYELTINAKADSKLAKDIYNDLTQKYQDMNVKVSGEVANSNNDVLPIWIVGLAIFCALIILIIMCNSYFEPFIFLVAILMAVVLNKGTNIIFPSVSFITNSIATILQLALSMDYSIMLMNRYNEERIKESDKVKAMKKALYHAFLSISSSSVTTIAGLLSLIFMSFTIGRDLGLVLAKGVLFSLLSIFFILPALVLMFDKLIIKTKKKSPTIKMDKFAKLSYKLRYLSIPVFIIVCILSFILKGNLGFDYTNRESDEISKVFKENNQIGIVYKKEDEAKIEKILPELEKQQDIEVLGYSNTINQKLPYEQLIPKFHDLGNDTEVADYLLKIIYYKYYTNEDNKMTLEDFISFIENTAYNNEKLNNKIDTQTKNNITRLKNFVSSNNFNRKMTSDEISNILEINNQDVKNLFIYYLSLNNNTKITLQEFVIFLNKDVLTNQEYAKKINSNLIKTFDNFTNKETLTTKMSSQDISLLFNIDKNLVDNLYLYYINQNVDNEKLGLNEFSSFVLDNFSSMLGKDLLERVEMFNNFSNKELILKEMNSKELSSFLNLNEEDILKLLMLKYQDKESPTMLSLEELVQGSLTLKDTIDIDLTYFENIYKFIENRDTKMNIQELNALFSNFAPNLVDNFSSLVSDNLTPTEFVELVINYQNLIDTNTLNQLKLLIDTNKYTSLEMSKLLNNDDINKLYVLIDFQNSNTDNYKMSPYETINLVTKNSDNQDLTLILNIMNSTLNNIEYTYQELGKLIGIDGNLLKNIYTLYLNREGLELTPYEFVNFILEEKDSLKIENDMVANLSLIQKIMNSIFTNQEFTSIELANLFKINQDDLKLLFGLYNYNLNKDYKISLKVFINYLLNDVVSNPLYKDKFSSDKVLKLETIKDIILNTNKKYSSLELNNTLNKLANVSKDTIDVLYLYYGSDREYNSNYKMTIEEFVNYLNNNILTDKRFDDFIDLDMKNEIVNAKDTIKDAKELLLGNNYSRVLLNTKFDQEGEETFKFIENLQTKVKDSYVIGDSAVAYDVSTTFNQELNNITIITMLVIFIVVALTFKSVIIPIVLVLTIQCAVFLTMGILSFTGDNVYFLAILIVQSILMGATIDYAILYTSYYLENRKDKNIKDSIINSYNSSINTILTSASILILVTLIVGYFASQIASKICITISEGTICSSLLIILLLPAILGTLDKFIVKRK